MHFVSYLYVAPTKRVQVSCDHDTNISGMYLRMLTYLCLIRIYAYTYIPQFKNLIFTLFHMYHFAWVDQRKPQGYI